MGWTYLAYVLLTNIIIRTIHHPLQVILILIISSFSELLKDAPSLLPGPFERDPTADLKTHEGVLYTMTTCHSLRLVDDELLGDPLDLKMFEFTGWSFQEGEGKKRGADEGNGHDSTAFGISPPVVRPPHGKEISAGGEFHDELTGQVNLPPTTIIF